MIWPLKNPEGKWESDTEPEYKGRRVLIPLNHGQAGEHSLSNARLDSKLKPNPRVSV